MEKNFLFDPYGYGLHLDRSRFDATLRELAAHAGTALALETRVISVEMTTQGFRIESICASRRSVLSTGFVIDASGRSAVFARGRGAVREVVDPMIAIVVYYEGATEERAIEPFTLVESAEDGWWYSAPLPRGRVVVTFMTDPRLIHPSKTNQRSDWDARVATTVHTAARVRRLSLSTAPQLVSAAVSRLDRVIGPRWAAVGDAAITFDPLASYGICKALESGIEVARAVAEGVDGRSTALVDYASTSFERFRAHLRDRASFYGMEHRHRGRPFWRRRTSVPTSLRFTDDRPKFHP